jgi:hypothetical protein
LTYGQLVRESVTMHFEGGKYGRSGTF